MKLYRLQRKQKLPITMDRAWDFFSSPLNLPAITPPWLNLRILEETNCTMVPGMVIQYRITPFLGIPTIWVSEITHVDPQRYFVDEQRLGPYRFWHHQHHFHTVTDGIEMEDVVTYAMKLGPIGQFIHTILVQRRLASIFDFRERALKQRLSS